MVRRAAEFVVAFSGRRLRYGSSGSQSPSARTPSAPIRRRPTCHPPGTLCTGGDKSLATPQALCAPGVTRIQARLVSVSFSTCCHCPIVLVNTTRFTLEPHTCVHDATTQPVSPSYSASARTHNTHNTCPANTQHQLSNATHRMIRMCSLLTYHSPFRTEAPPVPKPYPRTLRAPEVRGSGA